MNDTIDLKVTAPDWDGAGAGDDRTPVFTGYAVVGFFTNHQDAEAQALGLENDCGGKWDVLAIIPRPIKTTRQKTREEKICDLRSNAVIMAWTTLVQLQDATIDDLCRAAGIPLEVTE